MTFEGPNRFRDARHALKRIAQVADEWAGLPMPIEGEQLVIERSFKFASVFQEENKPDGRARSSFWSTHKRADVIIWIEDGRLQWGLAHAPHHFEQDLRTMGVSVAWGFDQEVRAMELLSTLVSEHAFRTYVMTGTFMESSRRSGVSYVFRRLRPTVAISSRGDAMKILCAMCLHPIAYYKGSWGGAMCPTDDVIAHLMLMRGDEHMFWRRANQHPAFRPEAGL